MFDTNFISVLYFEWWARLPSAWLQVQSLLGVSEECLNLLSVSKNHHHIKRSRYTSHVKVAFRITWYFQRIPTLTARLHCTFKAKHVASFFHRAILHLKNKKRVHKELFLLEACSGWGSGVMFWSHAMCVTNHWASTKKKGKQPAVISQLQDKAPENVRKLGRQWWKNRRVLPGVTLEAKCCCVKCQTSLAEAAMCQYHPDTLTRVQICLVSVKKKKYSICSATLT